MTIKKPAKIVYENQKKVHDLIVNKIKKSYLGGIKEAYLIGSLASGKFGRYKEKFEGYFGSDIDLVVLPKNIVPKKWKYEGEFYGWHKKYSRGKIKMKSIFHPINLMIPLKNNFDDMHRLAKELNWKVERIK